MRLSLLLRHFLILSGFLISSGCMAPLTIGLRKPSSEVSPPTEVASAKEPAGSAAPVPQVASQQDEKNIQLVQQQEQLPQPKPTEAQALPIVVNPELSLPDVIQLAFRANPDLQSATERTLYADAVLSRARADFFPVLAFNQEYQTSDNPLRKFSFALAQGQGQDNPLSLFQGADVEDNFHSQLRLQQELYSGGLRVARSRSAIADKEASMQALAAVQNRIVFQVAEAYYRSFQARELLQVREDSLRLAQQQLDTVQARFRAQTATQSDVLIAEVRLAQTKEEAIGARNALDLAWAILENVTGAPLAGRRLPTDLPSAPWSAQVESALQVQPEHAPIDSAVAQAVANRPELVEINRRIEAAVQRVRAAEAGKKPMIGFIGDYDLFTGDFRSQTTEGSFFVGLSLSLNLFDFGRTRANVRQAEAQVRELTAQERRIRLDIVLDVRRAYLKIKDARERLKVAESAVISAQEALVQIGSRYQNQNATATELTDAQVNLSDARTRVTNSRAELEVAKAMLARSLGRLATYLSSAETESSVLMPASLTP